MRRIVYHYFCMYKCHIIRKELLLSLCRFVYVRPNISNTIFIIRSIDLCVRILTEINNRTVTKISVRFSRPDRILITFSLTIVEQFSLVLRSFPLHSTTWLYQLMCKLQVVRVVLPSANTFSTNCLNIRSSFIPTI